MANDLDVNVTVSSNTDKTTPIDSSIGNDILPENVMEESTDPKEVANDLDVSATVSSSADMITSIDESIGDAILHHPNLPPVVIPNKTSAKNKIGSCQPPPGLLLTGDVFDKVKVIATGVMMDTSKGKLMKDFANLLILQ